MKKHILFIVLTLTLISCKNELEEKVEGFWTIDAILYKDESILFEMSPNIISFDDDGVCNLPTPKFDKNIPVVSNGIWIVNTLDTTITINTKIKYLNGNYKLYFIKDYDNKLYRMVMKNDSTYLYIRKGMQIFHENKDDW